MTTIIDLETGRYSAASEIAAEIERVKKMEADPEAKARALAELEDNLAATVVDKKIAK